MTSRDGIHIPRMMSPCALTSCRKARPASGRYVWRIWTTCHCTAPDRAAISGQTQKGRRWGSLSGVVELVGGTRIELVTPSMSRKCSTAELTARRTGLPREPRSIRQPRAHDNIPRTARITDSAQGLLPQLMDPVAQLRGIFKLEVLRVLVHLALEFLQHAGCLLRVQPRVVGG